MVIVPIEDGALIKSANLDRIGKSGPILIESVNPDGDRAHRRWSSRGRSAEQNTDRIYLFLINLLTNSDIMD